MNTLPRATTVGNCVLCTFVHFDPVRLFVEEMSDQTIAGFDLDSGHRKTLKIANDHQVIGEHGWPATSVSLMTETDVRLHMRERPAKLRTMAAEHERQANALSLTAESYEKKEIPRILRHFKAPRAAA